MKKLLLTSAALAALVVSSAAQAETNVSAGSAAWRPSLKISGSAAFSAHFHNSDRKHENSGKGRGTHFALEDSQVNFDVCGKADSFAGLEYGWLVSIDGDSSRVRDNKSVVKDNRIKLKNDYGTFMAGNMKGVTDQARGPHNFLGATGGYAGNYKNAINVSTGVVATRKHAGDTERATKVTVWTPRFWGFIAGVSYTPDSKHLGEGKLKSQDNSVGNALFLNGKSFNQNTWEGYVGVSHKLPYGFGINLSLTGMISKAKAGQNHSYIELVHDACSWAVGGDINYTYGDHVFTVGGEYLDNQKTNMMKTLRFNSDGAANTVLVFKDGDAGEVWSVGAAYEIGSYKVAYGYFNSRRDLGKVRLGSENDNAFRDLGTAKADVHSVTVDKKMAPGWGLYAEYNHFRFKTSDEAVRIQNALKGGAAAGVVLPGAGAALSDAVPSALGDGVGNNSGHSVIVGTKIKF